MPAPLLRLTLALTSAPVMVAAAMAWGTPALAAPPSVPGPLPVMGALAAFGASRKLRHRLLHSQRSNQTIG